MAMSERLRIGEVARSCGVSTDTVRHYERIGVIPAADRDGNGYRSYPAQTPRRIRIVRSALAIGFTLEEIARIFRVRASGRRPCNEVRALGATKLHAIDEQIRELQSLRELLSSTLSDWDQRLASVTGDEPAHLLESLAERRTE